MGRIRICVSIGSVHSILLVFLMCTISLIGYKGGYDLFITFMKNWKYEQLKVILIYKYTTVHKKY